jgi:general secretion pathway protein G
MYRHSERGVTLIEITIVLTVIAILTSAAAPIASRTVERARLSRAITDMQAIRTALSNFIVEVNYRGPKIDGGTNGNAITN